MLNMHRKCCIFLLENHKTQQRIQTRKEKLLQKSTTQHNALQTFLYRFKKKKFRSLLIFLYLSIGCLNWHFCGYVFSFSPNEDFVIGLKRKASRKKITMNEMYRIIKSTSNMQNHKEMLLY